MLLDGLVDAFSLTIGLRVKGGREIGLDFEHLEKLSPPLGGESRTPVGYNVVREAVYSEDVVQKLPCQDPSVIGLVCLDEVRLFGESVRYYKDGVEARRGGKVGNVIHR